MLRSDDLREYERRHHLWLVTVFSAGLSLGLLVVGSLVRLRAQEPPAILALRLGYGLLLAGIIGWLIVERARVNARRCMIAGLLIILPMPVLLWFVQNAEHALSPLRDPFEAHRLIILLVAVLMPATPRIVAGVVSVLTALLLLHYWQWKADGSLVADMLEPWNALVHWAVACVIVLFRAVLGRLSERYARARAALAALTEVVRYSRTVRDGVNTPLQTVEAISYLLRRPSPDTLGAARKLERASERLRQLLATLGPEDLVDWREDGIAFSAEDRLAALQEVLLREATFTARQRKDTARRGGRVGPLHPTNGRDAR